MDAFRNFVRGWFGKAFLTVVLAVFVVTMFWNMSPPGSQGELVKVNEQRIYKADLDQAVEAVMNRYGNQIDRKTLEKLVSRDAVLQTLIREHATIDAARTLGVVADGAAVQEMVKAMPAFQDQSGKFSSERFQQTLARAGFGNASVFMSRVEQSLISGQLEGAIADSAFATRQNLELLTRAGEQKRDLAWVELSPAAYAAAVTTTEAEVQARYDANPAAYMTDEQFAVDYLQVKLDDYAAAQKVDDDAARAKYDEMVQKANENSERRIAHILIGIDKNRDEKAAQARAAEVLDKLAKGGSFAALATQYSDDKGSAVNGGDLGYLGRGVLDPELDKAVAALKVNDVSPAVKAADGLHLLKVLDLRQVQMPSFESSKAGIVSSLKREKAKAKFDEVVGDLGTQVYESDNLHDPAAKLGLVVQTSALFTRKGGTGIAANPKVLDEILAPEVLEENRNSGTIEVAPGEVVVVHLKTHKPAEKRPFAEVAGQVRSELVREKALAVAREKAAALQKAVAGGQSLEQAAQGLKVQRMAAATRSSSGVPHEVLQSAFAMKRPADGAATADLATLADGAPAVLVVSNVIDGTLLGVADTEVQARRTQLAGEFGRYDYQHFADQALATAKVVRAKTEAPAAPVLPAAPQDVLNN